MNGWEGFKMENAKCQKCGKTTTFLGFDPKSQKELCLDCYNIMMSNAGKSDGMTSPIK